MFEGWGSSWEWATSICTFTGRSHPSFLFDIICFVCIFYLFCNICVGLSVQGTSSHLRKVGFQAHKNTQRIIFRLQKYSENNSLNFVKRESFHIEIKNSHRDFCNIVCPAAMCGGHHGSLKRIYINNIWLYTWLIFVTQLVVMMVATYIRCEKHLMKLKLNLVTSL